MHHRIARIVEALEAWSPDRIYLFGSWARDEQDELSDIDLVVIKSTQLSFFKRLQEVAARLPLELGAIDVFVYTPDEFEAMRKAGNAFAGMIEEEGRLIYVGSKER